MVLPVYPVCRDWREQGLRRGGCLRAGAGDVGRGDRQMRPTIRLPSPAFNEFIYSPKMSKLIALRMKEPPTLMLQKNMVY